jgi:hypothetical protein
VSAAQDAARTRNWRIRGLRALYAQCCALSPVNRAVAQGAIDAEFKAAGARTGAEHYAHVEAEWMKRRSQQNAMAEDEDIPF